MREYARFTGTVDKDIDEWLEGDVASGRFGSKAKAVNARLRQVKKLEDQKKDVFELFVQCMELVAEYPAVIEEFRKVWGKT